jgi:uncharacterized small protein (DUF1192 family)
LNEVLLSNDIRDIKRMVTEIKEEIARLKANLQVIEASRQADSMTAAILKRPVLSRPKHVGR